ncbi:glyoxylate/hydroxypyruvate reductase A [Aquimarina sp. AD1]|uniref:2-hydroxyacid dehydrogenase n=1 Tax=Aquimarina sp. (strain AD1) TaxID=1714848 RepID=UPI000E4F9234|nr:glyoxylate/hydroxypyruvate reductase A [Aquimarina sp. AD1]AXT54498.1 glyoxylate/hydroxypyruvate reductase A [Aquimarina sp. AD1]RKN06061.1 glyoxylate/hydroxypyruvate reductase A [Aquimarina sp. AD1]
MSILIIFNNKDPEPWKKVLSKKIVTTSIEIYPNVKDVAAVDFVICWKPEKDILKKFPNIKVIQSVGASIDHITNSQTIAENIIITRMVDMKLSIDMWEFLLTVVLMQLKNTKRYVQQQEKRIWDQKEYKSIENTTITILGLGSIGGYVAKKFADLGFTVKGWSNSKKEISGVKSFNGVDAFDSCLSQSDVLINLLPLTDETRDIINRNTLRRLATDAIFINVGRGEHLVEEDLIELLDKNKLAGAFLDVFRIEPLPKEHPFWKHPKIQITPHVASLTNVESATNKIVENYKRFLDDRELLNRVSLHKGY